MDLEPNHSTIGNHMSTGHYSNVSGQHRESPETALEDSATVTDETLLPVPNYVNVETPFMMDDAENKKVTTGLSKS